MTTLKQWVLSLSLSLSLSLFLSLSLSLSLSHPLSHNGYSLISQEGSSSLLEPMAHVQRRQSC